MVDTITAREFTTLLALGGLLLAVGIVQALAGVLWHRSEMFNGCAGAFRTARLVTAHAARLGATLPRRFASGEVIAVGMTDIEGIWDFLEGIARTVGAVVAITVIGGFLLSTSPLFGVLVLAGVPLIVLALGPLFRPLHHRQTRQRELQADLATRATDIVAGLRVLRGIGGERLFADRYRAHSQQVQEAGVRVGRSEALLRALRRLLPGLLTVGVVGVGAHLALAGSITPGQLVSFYVYTILLNMPIADLVDMVGTTVRGHVAARRVVRILRVRPDMESPRHPARPASPPPEPVELRDTGSGVVARRGRLTGIVTSDPGFAGVLADRLGRYRDDTEVLIGVPPRVVALGELPLAEVRRLVLVGDNDAALFSGTLREELSPGEGTPEELVQAALHTACAEDIVDTLPGSLSGNVTERGNELSGGQRQRLRLARALLLDPEVLVLVEPASAVDAHTEAAIADRLGKARAGRTTVVLTTSPLLLDRADRVLFVEDGRVVAEGDHTHLARTVPAYARAVLRGGEPEATS